jgi:hypothetical protein
MTTSTAVLAAEDFVPAGLGGIEREVSRQMKEAQGPGEAPVSLARMSNLVIFCNRADQAAAVSALVPDIVTVHPARVLLLFSEPGAEGAEISAAVKVRGKKAGSQFICSEQIVLRAREAAIDSLSFAVRALAIGDLPTNLWWASTQPPPLAGTLLYGLAEYAQQLVFDSQGWVDPHRAVAATANWLAGFERTPEQVRWRVASDLNWRRLKYWRRLLAQGLDPHSMPGVAKIQLGVEMSWQVATPHGTLRLRIRRLPDGPSEIRHVRIGCKIDATPCVIDCVVEDERRLAGTLEGVTAAPQTVTLQRESVAELVSRQLSDRSPDPVFRQSMAVAQVFAQSVLT